MAWGTSEIKKFRAQKSENPRTMEICKRKRSKRRRAQEEPAAASDVEVHGPRMVIIVSYDGTDFEGFQTQSHGRTVQDAIERRLGNLLIRGKSPLKIYGSGRTDTGVHARGQVVHFDLPSIVGSLGFLAGFDASEAASDAKTSWAGRPLSAVAAALQRALAGQLPPAIQVRAVAPAPGGEQFHARESCRGKRYVYSVVEGPGNPFVSRTAWVVRCCLTNNKMTPFLPHTKTRTATGF